MSSLLIKNGRLVTEKGLEQVDVFIEEGMIQRLDPANQQTSKPEILSPDIEVIDATGLLIFPGLIDCHVHFREPGMTEAEDMESGAAAAIAGGITTVCDMPNTNPPTCTVKALEDKIARAEKIRNIDIRFFFGVTRKEHLEELKKVKREDICGVKLYLGHSTGNQKIEDPTSRSALRGARGILDDVFKICAERGLPLVCHCEDEEVIQKNVEGSRRGVARYAPTDIRMHSEIRSVEAAISATTLAIAKKYGTHLHIAHLSTKEELDLVRRAKSEGLPVTCEVAPHHLFLTVEDYASLGTLAKMNPPLRTRDHCEALWEGIRDGTVDCIASDHAPHTLEKKLRRHAERSKGVMLSSGQAKTKHEALLEAPSGVPGVETMLPFLLSCLDSPGLTPYSLRLTPQYILKLLFTRPNEIFSLGKPGIVPGKPADIILVNPLAKWVIEGSKLHSRCGWTPYEGWEVQGKVVQRVACRP